MSLEALSEAVDALVLSGDPDELVDVLALRDRLNAKLAIAAGECRANQLYRLAGYGSLSAMLRARAQMVGRDAAELTRLGKKLREQKIVADAWLDSALSEGQVKAVCAIVKARHSERFAENEAAIVDTLGGLSMGESIRVLRDWGGRADALDDPPLPPEPDSDLFFSSVLDGRHEMSGSFSAEDSSVINKALAEAIRVDPTRSAAERRADALVDICQHYLNYHGRLEGRAIDNRERPHLNYGIDLDALRAGRGGYVVGTDVPIPYDAIRRLMCDANIHRHVFSGEQALLDYGRAYRSAPTELFQALLARDGGCRGAIYDPRTGTAIACDRIGEDCEAHHHVHWEDGGETNADNCGLFCRCCHRYLHRLGIRTRLLVDGTIVLTMRDGTTWQTKPRSQLPRPPVELPTERPYRYAGEPQYDEQD